jgi:hypothetical protein
MEICQAPVCYDRSRLLYFSLRTGLSSKIQQRKSPMTRDGRQLLEGFLLQKGEQLGGLYALKTVLCQKAYVEFMRNVFAISPFCKRSNFKEGIEE